MKVIDKIIVSDVSPFSPTAKNILWLNPKEGTLNYLRDGKLESVNFKLEDSVEQLEDEVKKIEEQSGQTLVFDDREVPMDNLVGFEYNDNLINAYLRAYHNSPVLFGAEWGRNITFDYVFDTVNGLNATTKAYVPAGDYYDWWNDEYHYDGSAANLSLITETNIRNTSDLGTFKANIEDYIADTTGFDISCTINSSTGKKTELEFSSGVKVIWFELALSGTGKYEDPSTGDERTASFDRSNFKLLVFTK